MCCRAPQKKGWMAAGAVSVSVHCKEIFVSILIFFWASLLFRRPSLTSPRTYHVHPPFSFLFNFCFFCRTGAPQPYAPLLDSMADTRLHRPCAPHRPCYSSQSTQSKNSSSSEGASHSHSQSQSHRGAERSLSRLLRAACTAALISISPRSNFSRCISNFSRCISASLPRGSPAGTPLHTSSHGRGCTASFASL